VIDPGYDVTDKLSGIVSVIQDDEDLISDKFTTIVLSASC
jgi:hypothetical protein